ncbi:MAG: bifunctional DNA-formamidopyrimidine glycosylase/DNA-(apurinic or apyrimidinic site) lyase [Candidatus Pacebacteria bacterium]|nr:bifunctional DNA-formamidopyrimidine glycosylase/DNA-(apurinic or apyrimidinic site) lyase [Candidatus Paceibacterota bacterium]MDD4074318.1 bifunctional DNA-formamidopyrimidine glycosylase/DNA-(apurinic or apyrimidinic site) lyase [Candidatus Paceibacterota bacterium]
MPELPEVEIIVRGLRKEVIGKTFSDVWTDTKKLVKQDSFEDFKRKLIGRKIVSIGRRGKNILIYLDNEEILLIHQKISGHLLLGKWKFENNVWVPPVGPLSDDRVNGYLHIVFSLDDGRQIALSDQRKFAKIEIIKDVNFDLGPEPLDIDFNSFKDLFKRKKGKIKQILMDQNFIAGIGNIYASEILYLSNVHPEESANKLDEKDLKKIYDNMQFILKESIRLKGDSFSDFRDLNGEKGGFQNIMKVYQKNGKECEKCGAKILRINLGGRGTFFCPNCQKKK